VAFYFSLTIFYRPDVRRPYQVAGPADEVRALGPEGAQRYCDALVRTAQATGTAFDDPKSWTAHHSPCCEQPAASRCVASSCQPRMAKARPSRDKITASSQRHRPLGGVRVCILHPSRALC